MDTPLIRPPTAVSRLTGELDHVAQNIRPTHVLFVLPGSASESPQRPRWQGDARRWRLGEFEVDLSYIDNEDVRKEYAAWLAGRPVDKRGAPFFWHEPRWNAPTLPVVGVTWFEAYAYCAWLSQKTGKNFRLPTECEWEKAARCHPVEEQAQEDSHGLACIRPWGDEWQPERCDSKESELGGTSPAGLYPGDVSSSGVSDRVGNVWEWCHDTYDARAYERRATGALQDPVITYDPRFRVLRGGSWHSVPAPCRSCDRDGSGPSAFDVTVGFRVVCSHEMGIGH